MIMKSPQNCHEFTTSWSCEYEQLICGFGTGTFRGVIFINMEGIRYTLFQSNPKRYFANNYEDYEGNQSHYGGMFAGYQEFKKHVENVLVSGVWKVFGREKNIVSNPSIRLKWLTY